MAWDVLKDSLASAKHLGRNSLWSTRLSYEISFLLYFKNFIMTEGMCFHNIIW